MSQALSAARVKLVPWWLVLIEGVLLIIIGIFLMTQPIRTWTALVWVIGLYWLISGIFNIVKIFFDRSLWGWKLFAGVVGIVAGYFLVTTPFGGTLAFTASVVLLLGLFGIFIGIVNLIQAFRGAGWGTGMLGVISIILGILILSNQQAFILSLPWAVGILAILGGIIAIFNAFRIRGAKKDLEAAADAAAVRTRTMADAAASRTAAAGAATAGAVGAAAAAARDQGEEASRTATAAVEDAGESVMEMSEQAAEAVGDIGEAAGETVEDAANAAAAAAASVAAAVDDAGEEVQETAEDVSTRVRSFDLDLAEPDEELTASVSEMFPNLNEEQRTGIANLVAAVRSLDPQDAEKLREAAVERAETLLERGASRQGREELAKDTGIDASTILKWVNDLDLKRIKGVGVKYAHLLEASGVDTVVELAQRNPQNLFNKLVEVNEAEQLVEALPTESDVEEWVAQAKGLPRVITY